MNNRDWLKHIEKILSGKRKSALELTLVTLPSTNNTKGRSFFQRPKNESEIKNKANRAVAIYQLSTQLKAKYLEAEQESEIIIMESVNPELKRIDRMIDNLSEIIGDLDLSSFSLNNTEKDIRREKTLTLLGMVFLEAAKYGDIELGEAFIKHGFPVNFQNPNTEMTALHYSAAGSGLRAEFTSMLMNSGKCDYLIKDCSGDLAFDRAYRFGRIPEICKQLREKTLEQAQSKQMNLCLPPITTGIPK